MGRVPRRSPGRPRGLGGPGRTGHRARLTAASWPDELRLDGFRYDSLGAGVGDAAARLGWLRRSPGYAPQPYEQPAAHYRRAGHDDEARRVLLAKQRHRRATARPAARVWGYLFDATVGYGYRPWLAAVWLGVLVPPAALVLIPIGGLGQRTAWYWPGQAVQWLAYVLSAVD